MHQAAELMPSFSVHVNGGTGRCPREVEVEPVPEEDTRGLGSHLLLSTAVLCGLQSPR